MGEASNIEPLKFNVSDMNEDMLHTILELVSDGIWDWNANTGFVYRNPGWYEMLGYAAALPGQHRVDLGKRDPPRRLPAGHGPVR